jgi:multidrug efflux pump subunit AcrA (membrane-fusion protein)
MPLFLTGLWTFVKSPLGLGLGAAFAILVFVQVQRNDAADGAAAECKADVYQQQLKDLQTKLDAAQALAKTNQDKADQTEAARAAAQKEADDLKATLPPDGNPPIPPAVRHRVQQLK